MTNPGDRPRSRTETFDITISGLLTKRADTFGEMMRLRDRLVELEGDLGALDRVLVTFGYADELEAVQPRQLRDAPFGWGQMMRAILNCMREASELLTARQIAEAAAPAIFGDCDDARPLDSLARRGSKALGRLKRDGAIDGPSDGTGVVRWALRF